MTAADIADIEATIDHWYSQPDIWATIVAVATELHCSPARQGLRRAMIEHLVDHELGTSKQRAA